MFNPNLLSTLFIKNALIYCTIIFYVIKVSGSEFVE